MTKRAMIDRIAAATGLSKAQTGRMVQLWMDELARELSASGRVELRNFGVFTVTHYDGYTTVNPATGEPRQVRPHRRVRFKAGKALKAKLEEDP